MTNLIKTIKNPIFNISIRDWLKLIKSYFRWVNIAIFAFSEAPVIIYSGKTIKQRPYLFKIIYIIFLFILIFNNSIKFFHSTIIGTIYILFYRQCRHQNHILINIVFLRFFNQNIVNFIITYNLLLFKNFLKQKIWNFSTAFFNPYGFKDTAAKQWIINVLLYCKINILIHLIFPSIRIIQKCLNYPILIIINFIKNIIVWFVAHALEKFHCVVGLRNHHKAQKND